MVMASPFVIPAKDPQKPSLILDKRLYKAQNLFTNSDFSSLTGWSTTTGSPAYSAANGVVTFTNMGSSSSTWKLTQKQQSLKPTAVTVGHVYYLVVWMQSNSSSDGIDVGGVTASNQYHTGGGGMERLSTTCVISASQTWDMRVLYSARTGDISANPVLITRPMLIDLTATFGLGKEPSKAECDILFLEWFQDIKYVYQEDKQRILTNVVQNGNFANGTVGWVANGGTIAVNNGWLILTGNNTSRYVGGMQTTLLPACPGNRFYVRALVMTPHTDSQYIYLSTTGSVAGTATYTGKQTPTQNVEYLVSNVVTQNANCTGYLKIGPFGMYADTATANGKETRISQMAVINLTKAYGEGREPAKVTMDALVTSWFEGQRAA